MHKVAPYEGSLKSTPRILKLSRESWRVRDKEEKAGEREEEAKRNSSLQIPLTHLTFPSFLFPRSIMNLTKN